ncbi:hypothetical protein Dimus_016376 [Dionaea muscipula]
MIARNHLRVKCLVDITRSLPRGLEFQEFQGDSNPIGIHFRYERLSDICYNYGMLGHDRRICSHATAVRAPPDRGGGGPAFHCLTDYGKNNHPPIPTPLPEPSDTKKEKRQEKGVRRAKLDLQRGGRLPFESRGNAMVWSKSKTATNTEQDSTIAGHVRHNGPPTVATSPADSTVGLEEWVNYLMELPHSPTRHEEGKDTQMWTSHLGRIQFHLPGPPTTPQDSPDCCKDKTQDSQKIRMDSDERNLLSGTRDAGPEAHLLNHSATVSPESIFQRLHLKRPREGVTEPPVKRWKPDAEQARLDT